MFLISDCLDAVEVDLDVDTGLGTARHPVRSGLGLLAAPLQDTGLHELRTQVRYQERKSASLYVYIQMYFARAIIEIRFSRFSAALLI